MMYFIAAVLLPAFLYTGYAGYLPWLTVALNLVILAQFVRAAHRPYVEAGAETIFYGFIGTLIGMVYFLLFGDINAFKSAEGILGFAQTMRDGMGISMTTSLVAAILTVIIENYYRIVLKLKVE